MTVTRQQRQDSRLLDLPPELRNLIYELLCTHTKKVATTPGHEVKVLETTHPLSQTCRQLRQEFGPIFASLAPHYSRKILCYVRYFSIPSLDEAMMGYLESLAPPSPAAYRIFTQRLFLDNTFDSHSFSRCPDLLFPPATRTTTMRILMTTRR